MNIDSKNTLIGLKEAVQISNGEIPLKEKPNMPAPAYFPDMESNLTDSRLAEPSNGSYRWKDMIREVERLGRPLTEEEAEKYKVK